MKIRRVAISILALLLLTLHISQSYSEVKADCSGWSFTFDFTTSDYTDIPGLTYEAGTWTEGVGVVATPGGTGVGTHIDIPSVADSHVSEFTVVIEAAGTATLGFYYNHVDTSQYAFVAGNTNVPSGSYTDNFGTDVENGGNFVFNPNASTGQGGAVTLVSVTMSGTGINPITGDDTGCTTHYTRPYRTADESTVTDLEGFTLPAWTSVAVAAPLAQVYAISKAPGAPVMAAEDGTVTLRALTSGDCSLNLWGIVSSRCTFVLGHDLDPLSGFFDLFSFETTDDTWLVTLNGADGKTFNYVVSNADFYLTQDMEVHAGCVIGESIAYEGAVPTDISTLLTALVGLIEGINTNDIQLGSSHGQGISLIRFYDNSDDLLSGFVDPVLASLTDYNEDAQPCNLTPGLQDCLNHNTEFRRNGEEWTAVGSMDFGPLGVILNPGASLEQQLNLTADTEYSFVIHAGWVPDGDIASRVTRSVRLRLGTDTQDLTIASTGAVDEYDLPMDIHPPDVGDTFWTIRVQNTGPKAVFIQDACVTSSETHTTPQACYFANSTFDDYDSGWDASTPSPIVLFFAGYAQIPDSGWVKQSVTLTAGDYVLTVTAHTVGNWDGTGEAPSAELFFTYPDDGGSPVSAGALDPGYNLPGHVGYPSDSQTFTTNFTVSDDTTGGFKISSTISGTGVDAIALDSACIQAADGSTGGGVVGPPTPQCSTAAKPQGNDFGPWITWQWHNLDQFFQCDLMVLLNKMYHLAQDDFRMVGFWIKWQTAFVRRAVTWSDSQLFPWLNGQFRNIATGQVTTITGGDTGCHDVFCAIVDVIGTLSNTLTPIVAALANAINALVAVLIGGVNFFFTVAAGLLGLIVAIVGRMFTFVVSIIQLLTSIITAYNTATPVTIPGLPQCATDPNSSLICAAVWVMDNTMFQGRWQILFDVILAILAVHLVLWAIGEFRGMLLKMGGAS